MTRRSEFTIRDEGGSLLIRSRKRSKLWLRLAEASVIGLAGMMFINEQFHAGWWAIVALVAGTLAYFSMPGASKAELRISALECHTRANFSKSLMQGRTVLTGDILWLEYNEQGLTMSDSAGRGGLYAVRRSGNICLLPLLDGQQTTEIIVAIENKFPGLAEMWRKRSPWTKAVQTAGPI